MCVIEMAVTDLVDWVLDKTVVPGYSRIGPRIRRSWWPADPAPDSLLGKRVLITGATSGIGMAAAARVAALGATVHLLGRDSERTERSAREVRAAVPDARVETEQCDVANLADVRSFSAQFASRVDHLHGLLHNAGVMNSTRQETEEGHEVALATHVLGPFLLTRLLRDVLAADGDARVIFMSSGGMYAGAIHPDDFEYRSGTYSATTAYARTKRMQVVLAELLAEHLRTAGIAVHSMHPGWVDTPGVRSHLPRFRALTRPLLRDNAGGADTLVWLTSAPEASRSTGLFWHDRRARPTSFGPSSNETEHQRTALWEMCRSTTESP